MGCMELKDLLARVLYSIDDVVEIIVGNHGTAGEAEAFLEEFLADAVDVGRSIFVNWLQVHGFP